ncbi:MAG: TetR/AcrR family transcriptional repressor of mexJK operon [Alphaproteobacteria bacterium]|jgi:TetR/AcrR family transcriptional repressor of mexJK operon
METVEPTRTSKELSIINAACTMFLKQGFKNTCMDKIAIKAGVSKQTIYSNFGSKENLFNEVITHLFKDLQKTFKQEEQRADPQESLTQFIVNILTPLFSKDGINLHRLVCSEGPNNEKLNKIYISRLERGLSKLSTRISYLESIGLIASEDSHQMAHNLIYSCKGLMHTKLLCGYITEVSPDEINYIARRSVDRFFEQHKPQTS